MQKELLTENSHNLGADLINSIDILVITAREFTKNGFRMYVEQIYENKSGNWMELQRQ